MHCVCVPYAGGIHLHVFRCCTAVVSGVCKVSTRYVLPAALKASGGVVRE